MSGTQLLRLLVNERLTAAAGEIFGLVEKTIAEYQDEAVRSKREVIRLRQQIEQLNVLKPAFRADTQQVSEELPPSSQQYDIKEEEIQEHQQVKEEEVDQCISPDMEADISNNAEAKGEINQQMEQMTVLKEEVTVFRADTLLVSEELPPSSQQYDIKVKEIQQNPEVKEEQVDQCNVSNVEVRHPESESATNSELFPSSTAETVNVNESIDDKLDESDGSSSPPLSHNAEISVGPEQPLREEKICHFCGNIFMRFSDLIRHVAESHKGHKAFKCLECNKEFEKRPYLMLHKRTHTGEKPFHCGFCDKTFIQRSTCLAHMRVHTGEKPYFCKKCGKSFASSNHFKLCKLTPEKGNADEDHREEKAFKCFHCDKEFKRKSHLNQHTRIHTGEKPFGCDYCDKTFTQKVACVFHMRTHTGEKPYLCKKCGKRFTTGRHAKKCTGTQNKSTNKSCCCTTCGRSFHTESDLKVHAEVHESWKRHISEKLGQELEETKL